MASKYSTVVIPTVVKLYINILETQLKKLKHIFLSTFLNPWRPVNGAESQDM